MDRFQGSGSASQGIEKIEKPSQIKFIRPGTMAMHAKVCCHPPLGQVTVVPEDTKEIRFTVVLESSKSFPAQDWEAAIYDTRDDSDQEPLVLERTDDILSAGTPRQDYVHAVYEYTFSGVIALTKDRPHPFPEFNVLYRNDHTVSWRRADYELGFSNGRIVYEGRHLQEEDSLDESFVFDYIPGLPKDDLKLEKPLTSSPDTKLVKLTGRSTPDEESDGGSRYSHVVVGKPEKYVKYFSLVRTWTPWLAPRHGNAKKKFYLSEDAMLCSFLTKKGTHFIILALSGITEVQTTFQSTDKGELVIKVRDDEPGSDPSEYQLLVAESKDFEGGLEALMQEARRIVRMSGSSSENDENLSPVTVSPPDSDTVMVEDGDVDANWLQSWFDGLAWCTWNGIGQDLTEEKIMKGLESLKENDIKITNLIIDDNWQSLDNAEMSQFQQGMTDFDANLKGFPNGLKHTTSLIRKNHPNIESIAVWHALLGYWGGISPEGSIARNYKTTSVVKAAGPAAGSMLAVDPDDVQRFYNDFYSFLSSVGIDGVKTDAQFFIDMLENREDRRRFNKAYQNAWEISSLRYFSNKTISCMSQVPQIIFHSQLPTNKPTNLVRNSDDFFPDIPGSHPWHVFCNAHNTLLCQHLNALPDWDMFQTVHPYSSFHGAARCISGGPIYITDEPGKHDIKLIKQMTALTTRGNTVILRPAEIGRTLDIYNDYNEGHVLRIGSRTGFGAYEVGLIGLFNIVSGEKACIVPLADFKGVHRKSKEGYIVRSFQSGKVSDISKPNDSTSIVAVTLEDKGWEMLSSYPIHTFDLHKDQTSHVAVLGLVDKITGAAAVVSQDIYLEENGRLRFQIALKAMGVLGIYVSNLEEKTVDDSFMIMFLKTPVPRHTVKKSKNGKVLEVDLETAWKELKLRPGWSNELHLDVLMS